MANTWEQLLTLRGPHDLHNGVQLVLSCSLAGTYALLCMSPRIRKMSHVARGLGSVWARECGFYCHKAPNEGTVPSITAPYDQKLEAWQKWAAEEVQARALLWQYVIDGLLSHFYRHSTLLQHETNPLLLPTSSAAFEAATVDAWIEEMSDCGWQSRPTVRAYVKALFVGDTETTSKPISEFGIRVVLECLQSLILREAEAAEETIGLVSKQEICVALLNLKYWQLHDSRTAAELLLRWHAVFISMSANVRQLCAIIGPARYVNELFHHSQEVEENKEVDLRAWVQTPDARRALLHAMAVAELAQNLSFGNSYAIHVPFAIFSAAAVVAAFVAGEVHSLPIPTQIDWAALYQDLRNPIYSEGPGAHPAEMVRFLAGSTLPEGGATVFRKISTEISIFHSHVKAMSGTWGITRSMQKLLEQWAQLPRGRR